MTYLYFSLFSLYLNLGEEPQWVAETGEYFSWSSSISFLLVNMEHVSRRDAGFDLPDTSGG